MANLYYKGEKWKIEGTLVDSEDSSILFTDVVSMTIQLIDEMGIKLEYTKADSEITVGSTTSSYAVEVPETDTVLLTPGKIQCFTTIEFPSSDFTGNAIDKICVELLTLSECP